jgi:hypothetical protein
MNYTKLKTIEKLNEYKQMYLKAQEYKNDSIGELKRFETPKFMDFLNLKEYRKNRVKIYQNIQDRIEQRINNLIKELKN